MALKKVKWTYFGVYIYHKQREITLKKMMKKPNSLFSAVQNSSIGDLVTHSLTDSLTHGNFTFDIQRATLET